MTTSNAISERGIVRNILVLARPKFLFYSAIMHGVGVAAAYSTTGKFNLELFLVAQGFVWSLHLATHFCNEFFDLEADRRNTTFTRWTGGSRVLVDGGLPPFVALLLAMAMLALCAAAVVYTWWVRPSLVADVPKATWALALVALLLAWEYSAPPLKLTSRGLGEATIVVILCILLPGMGFLSQGGIPQLAAALTLLPVCAVQYARMMVMNIPDAEGDEAAGKRTLVVRLGVERAVRVHNLIQLAAYGSIPLLMLLGANEHVLFALLFTAPLSALQVVQLQRGAWKDPQRFNGLAFRGTLHIVTVGVAALIGFLEVSV